MRKGESVLKLPAYVEQAIARLEKSGYSAYVVGGAVRDNILGKTPKDYDLCTDATADQMTDIFAEFPLVKTGAGFGTVRVVMGQHMLDITTFRADGDYSDARHPDTVTFGNSLKEDLARRDFTINAIAYNPKEGYIDYFGGQADLQARVVRCVGDPKERFQQDALRILRAIRFAARLDFAIDAKTELAALDVRHSLRKLSAERVRDELSAFIVCKDAGVLLLRYRSIFFEIIPELAACDGFGQHNPNHNHDVLGHIAETINRADNELALRLAALLHDIGKPQCFTLEGGRGRFFGHMEVSAKMARDILARLRYPTKLIDTVCVLVENHDKPYQGTPHSARQWLGRLGSKNLFLLIKLRKADCLAHDPSYHNRLLRIAGFKRAVTAVLQRGDCYSLTKLAVNGNDVNRVLGISAGSETGAVLQYLLERVMVDQMCNNKKTLLAMAKDYADKNDIGMPGAATRSKSE